MSESTCMLCQQRFGSRGQWCKSHTSCPETPFCAQFIPHIPMEAAQVQFFRTGSFPDGYTGIQDTYYSVVDETSGRINFIKSAGMYQTLKEALSSVGIDIDTIRTIEELHAIESEYYGVIESLLDRKQSLQSNCTAIDDAFEHVCLTRNDQEKARLAEIIFKRDRLGLSVLRQ